jgi:predicted PurR-regulated permease PerM
VSDSQTKQKLIDVLILSIATLTVIGTYYAQGSKITNQATRIDMLSDNIKSNTEWRSERFDMLEASVKSNTAWRNETQKTLDAIVNSMQSASEKIDSAKEEILQQIDGKRDEDQ